ncbi:NGG1p interacting factor 3 [Crepidotus variabilis]|uniref:NGG1p interacting factor 3 n=1 Tax=Crepidotus variabilis TaxID=179855 RepID=A0A9P6EFQ4_9AGAR|nr:NGG1p interacting factor 3 [Crepidotus variabilis]
MSNFLTKSVCEAMERIAPLRLASSWDNVGLLLESPVQRQGKRTIMLTTDLTTSVLDESVAKDTSVIVTYHPTIFRSVKALTLSNPLQASLLRCAAQGISVYSPHTSLDTVWGGINDWLAEGCIKNREDGEIRALSEERLNATSGKSEGAEGRLVTFREPILMGELQSRIKAHLKLTHVQVGYAFSKKPLTSTIRSIAICAGSGGDMLVGRNADVYLTGEMMHHDVLAAVAAGKHVILCGHTNTERGYLPLLAQKLRQELPLQDFQDQGLEVDILVSEQDRHPLEIV